MKSSHVKYISLVSFVSQPFHKSKYAFTQKSFLYKHEQTFSVITNKIINSYRTVTGSVQLTRSMLVPRFWQWNFPPPANAEMEAAACSAASMHPKLSKTGLD